LANTHLTQQIRAAVTGKNPRCLESIYAGSGLVLASFATSLLRVLAVGIVGGLLAGETKFFLFGLEFVFDVNLD
jgi:hypothetical protein